MFTVDVKQQLNNNNKFMYLFICIHLTMGNSTMAEKTAPQYNSHSSCSAGKIFAREGVGGRGGGWGGRWRGRENGRGILLYSHFLK